MRTPLPNEPTASIARTPAPIEGVAATPGIVLLDIGLPKLNGYDAARRIRAESSGVAMHLIALTGWGQQQDRRRALEAGFDQHLVKPVDHGALTKLLAEVKE